MRFKILFTITFALVSGFCVGQEYRTEYTIAQDGSGDYRSLVDVMKACKAFPDKRIIIRIKPGVYKEKVEVFSWTTNVSWIGEDPNTTVVTFDDYSGKGQLTTFSSYSVKISGAGFYAENITFENSAGPVGQAVALFVEADRCMFVNCRFLGNQDTIYGGGESSRQYFKNCYIEGTTDFIFGGATAVFENCIIHSKKNSYITAASTPEGKAFGYVFLQCELTATPEATQVYLGRPWRNFAKTVFINTTMGKHILPEGWHNWSKRDAEKTTFYAEYKSTGPGASDQSRVGWSNILTEAQASQYTIEKIFGDWNVVGK
jgi:pectinesterase